jgi:hypothetical protein
VPDNAHKDPELVAAVEHACSGLRPFGLVFRGRAEVLLFAGIRILDKSPEGPEDWRRVGEVLSWKSEITKGVAQWNAIAEEFSLPKIHQRPEEAARALHACLEKFSTV